METTARASSDDDSEFDTVGVRFDRKSPVPTLDGMETTVEDIASLKCVAEKAKEKGLGVDADPDEMLRLLRDYGRQSAEIARLTAEKPPVPPDREQLARQLLIIAGSGVSLESDRRELREAARALRLPADGWREGAEAMRDAIGNMVAAMPQKPDPFDGGRHADEMPKMIDPSLREVAAAIRALPLPSPPEEKKT